MSCSKKRLSECSEPCYWIKGKGCVKKTYKTPKWKNVLDEKFTVPDISEISGILLRKTKEDTEEAVSLKNSGLDWIYRKYTTPKFKICIVWDEESRKTGERFQWIDFEHVPKKVIKSNVEKFGRRKLLYIPEDFKNKLQNCISLNNDIIIIPFHLEIYIHKEERFSRHANIIIINKFLRTIEFYDSNGYEYHKQRTKNADASELKKFFKSVPELGRYRLVLYKDLPFYGFQNFESEESQNLGEKGKCMFWSLFIAELRTKYYKMDPVEMMEKLMSEVLDEKKSKEYNEFIKGYIGYLKKNKEDKNIKVTELLTPEARGAYDPRRQKGSPIWYKSRSDELNFLNVLAERYLEQKYSKTKKVCVVYNANDISDIAMWIDFSKLDDENFKIFKSNEMDLIKKLRGQRIGLYISEAIWDKLNNCVNSENDLIILPLSYRTTKNEGGLNDYHKHKVVIIINKNTTSIELYDPNGGQTHKEWFNNNDVPYIVNTLKSIPILKTYSVYTFSDTFYRGFQSYHAEAKSRTRTHHLERGVCAVWSTFISDLRAKYSHLQVYQFTSQILDSIDVDERPDFFKNLIENYMSYLTKKLGNSRVI